MPAASAEPLRTVISNDSHLPHPVRLMIFYFSGTGNSEWAARQLAEQLSQTLVSIADDMRI
jgi:hypothetical protein